MLMPRQAKPVARTRGGAMQGGITPSDGPACTLCRLACNQLSGIAKDLCMAACQATVC